MTRKLRTRPLLATAVALAGLAIGPAAASAGPLVASGVDCSAQKLSQPFLPWADVASYTLNPGGTFEGGAQGWTLSGAALADGNEPFYVTAARDSTSLEIASGGSATSAAICVGIAHPDMRFFAKASNPNAVLTVEVLFQTANGDTASAPIGTVTGGVNWAPTVPMPLVVNLLPLLPGNTTPVAFRFSVSGGSFRIDDVYVDPYARS
jgi:hypothetical protein